VALRRLPKCWQNTVNISATLSNPGTDIEKDVANQFGAADLQKLSADVAADISTMGSGSNSSPLYIGGHFNLNLTPDQIAQFSDADQAAFASDFAPNGAGDGVRQAAGTGLAAAMGYFLHSQVSKNDPGIVAGEYSFHFDRFSGTNFPVGTAGHFFYDVLGGHLGHPCLDPAWHH
jgi:hypothetical protein